ncbi:uncharacterized protein MEPE_00326 [Melanopsichium pennsylvanicum]|uniref:Uncharacterized protein n=2 Tax=Melanopsichium pennsylvanicum TaxID=63383 RepID=A0AAJ4XGF9_9BASI|nr:putative protein [Melanopsichium pennsylvanicum 4]SNX81621.1 uncharacterized protein MEPE_00326 [Melanopsichium pennsylvanicum]
MSSVEDENFTLALTFLSLYATPPAQSSPPLPPSSDVQPPSSLASSLSSWADVPPSEYLSSGPSDRPQAPYRTTVGLNTTSRKGCKKSSIRAGLSSLSIPPCPFGSQLGTSNPPVPANTSLRPYSHIYQKNYFNLRPNPRALKVENNEIPLPEPEYVYDTALQVLESAMNLIVAFGKAAAVMITNGGKKCLGLQLAKIGLVAVVCIRPRWAAGVMNASLEVLRDPWQGFHRSIYVWVMANVLAL